MAGTVTFTYDDGADRIGQHGNVKKVIADWVSDASDGTASGTSSKIVGTLIKGVTNPSGTAAPTDDYDIAITDAEGLDVLAGSFADLGDRDTANTEEVYFGLTDGSAMLPVFPVVCDPLTVSVTNAGNSKAGRLVLYYKPL